MVRTVSSALIPNYNPINRKKFWSLREREKKSKTEGGCNFRTLKGAKTQLRRFRPCLSYFHVEPCHLSARRFPKPSGDDILTL